MDEDVVLGQVSVHQVALLVHLAHKQHHLRVEDLHLLLRSLRVLQNHQILLLDLCPFYATCLGMSQRDIARTLQNNKIEGSRKLKEAQGNSQY